MNGLRDDCAREALAEELRILTCQSTVNQLDSQLEMYETEGCKLEPRGIWNISSVAGCAGRNEVLNAGRDEVPGCEREPIHDTMLRYRLWLGFTCAMYTTLEGSARRESLNTPPRMKRSDERGIAGFWFWPADR